jgi:hypothetical protein
LPVQNPEAIMIALDVVFFATADARWWEVLDDYVAAANYHLANFDMVLSCSPKRPDYGPIGLRAFGPLKDRDGDPGRIRQAAHEALPQGRGIPVLFCQLRSGAGQTILRGDKDANGGVDWLSYVMLNGKATNPQNEVLLHELVHAADYSGDTDPWGDVYLHDQDPGSIESQVPLGSPRPIVALQEKHAVKLRRAYFARAL